MLALLAGACGTTLLPAGAEEEKPSDRGIGGTGIMADDGPGARAIGFIGTIQRFGSIYVNDARITYPDDVEVLVDGRRSGASALAIGQVVSTVAEAESSGKLRASRITVVSEVIGPVESISGDTLKVLGQSVVAGKKTERDGLAIGTRIAVSGLRTAEGVIIASRIEPAGTRPDQVVGTPAMHGWTLRIGDLPLIGLGEVYEGWRVIVQGTAADRGLRVQRARVDTPFAGASIGRASIEAYVERSGGSLRIGPGTELRGVPVDGTFRSGRNVRAVLDIGIEASGTMRLYGLTAERRLGRRTDESRFGSQPVIKIGDDAGFSVSPGQASMSQMKGVSGIGLAGQGSIGGGTVSLPGAFGNGGSIGGGDGFGSGSSGFGNSSSGFGSGGMRGSDGNRFGR